MRRRQASHCPHMGRVASASLDRGAHRLPGRRTFGATPARPASVPPGGVDHLEQRPQASGTPLPVTPESSSGVFLAARFRRAACSLSSFRRQRVDLVERDDLGLVGRARRHRLRVRRARSCRPCRRARRCRRPDAAARGSARHGRGSGRRGRRLHARPRSGRECRPARIRGRRLCTTPSCGCSVVKG